VLAPGLLLPPFTLLLGVWVATGCTVEHRVVTTGADIHRELPALRANGSAAIDAREETGDKQEPRRATVAMNQRVTARNKRFAVSDLAEDCPVTPHFNADGEPLEHCGLLDLRHQSIELGRYQTRSVGTFVRQTVGFTILGTWIGSGICWAACPDDSSIREASKYTFLTTAAVAVVWMLVDCAGRWGQPGCRD